MATPSSKSRKPSRPEGRSDGTSAKSRLLLVIAVFVFTVIAFLFLGDGLWQSMTKSQDMKVLEVQVDSLKDVIHQMEITIKGLKEGDPETIEKEAYDQGMHKPGEKIFLKQPMVGKPKKK
ncbi:MAG: septum formation initiator family protein [Candidatus Hatepunaea meridiana]|nr:septum formation initiator family protein [Candidatus Hatepunaea meridiana]